MNAVEYFLGPRHIGRTSFLFKHVQILQRSPFCAICFAVVWENNSLLSGGVAGLFDTCFFYTPVLPAASSGQRTLHWWILLLLMLAVLERHFLAQCKSWACAVLWHQWPDWHVPSAQVGSTLESGIQQAFTRDPAPLLGSVGELGEQIPHGTAVILLLTPSRLAPARHLPGSCFAGLEFSSWKMCWGVEEKEFGIYGALKTECSFSREDFRIGFGEGGKELVER